MFKLLSLLPVLPGGIRRRFVMLALAVAVACNLVVPGCTQAYAGKPRLEPLIMTSKSQSLPTEMSGTYISRGNAVDCPQIRKDDGHIQPVIGLSAAIVPGDRVRVTGRYGISTRCVGEVLIVEEEEKLPQ